MGAELIAPAAGYVAVTASDSTDLGPARAFYVGVTGTLVLSTGLTGAGVTFAAIPAGAVLPVSARRVLAASTATSVVALY
jgi:hypothetical protein